MWDSPRLLNGMANALFALALLLALLIVVRAEVESPMFALKTIRVEGELLHVSRAEVIQVLEGRLRGTFFTVDIESIRAMFEEIPWVRRAQVRRVWPDTVEVQVEEHLPIAHWNRDNSGPGLLVSAYGDVFLGHSDAPLLRLSGPEGTERDVVRRFVAFRDALAPIGLEPVEVSLSPRYAWQTKLNNGLLLHIGRDLEKDPAVARLERFVRIYPHTVARMSRRPSYVDLRYSNGLALRAPESDNAEPKRAEKPRGKA